MSDDNNPFNILGSEKVPVAGGTPVSETNTELPLEERIKGLLGSADVFLFMKGTPDMPMCGFSANVISILNAMNSTYKTFNKSSTTLTDIEKISLPEYFIKNFKCIKK